MASSTHLLTLALLAISATATDAGYSQAPPLAYTRSSSPPNGGGGMFPSGFPFNNPPFTIPGMPPFLTSTAAGVFTTLPPGGPSGPGGPGGGPGGPGGPGFPIGPGPVIDPNRPRIVTSLTVVTHTSSTVISYTNTIFSLSTVTNSLCVPLIPIPTVPGIQTTNTADGAFTTSSLPGGDPLTTIPITTLTTIKVTVPPVTLPTIPGGPNLTLPTIPIPTGPLPTGSLPTGPIPTGPIIPIPTLQPGGGDSNTSKPFSFTTPSIQTYPPSYPAYPPTYGNGRV